MTLAAVARETLEIVDRGGYVAPSGRRVDLSAAIAASIAGTVLYRPDQLRQRIALARPQRQVARRSPGSIASNPERATGRADDARAPWWSNSAFARAQPDGRRIRDAAAGAGAPRIEVTREGTGEAGQRLWAEGEHNVVALNFASGRRVGGGFLSGARAQEEELCRASALFRCLEAQPAYYHANRAHPDALYTDHVVYSPRVPFFRDPARRLLEEPFHLSVITAPAPNTRSVLQRDPNARPAVAATFARRAEMVLAVARDRGHDCLLLGAWGCGAFGGDPEVVAEAFDRALTGPFSGAFRRVVFAILVARDADQRNYDVFRDRW